MKRLSRFLAGCFVVATSFCYTAVAIAGGQQMVITDINRMVSNDTVSLLGGAVTFVGLSWGDKANPPSISFTLQDGSIVKAERWGEDIHFLKNGQVLGFTPISTVQVWEYEIFANGMTRPVVNLSFDVFLSSQQRIVSAVIMNPASYCPTMTAVFTHLDEEKGLVSEVVTASTGKDWSTLATGSPQGSDKMEPASTAALVVLVILVLIVVLIIGSCAASSLQAVCAPRANFTCRNFGLWCN